MIIMKWVEKFGKAVMVPSTNKSIVISASSPLVLIAMINEYFDPKIHEMALLVRFHDSKFVLMIEGPGDVPIFDIIDPTTGKWLIKYTEKDPDEERFLRVE